MYCLCLNWTMNAKSLNTLLVLACLMGQYCFARWRLSSVGVVCRRL